VTPWRTTLAAGAVAAGVVVLDQVTKALVRGGLALGEQRDVVACVDIVHVRNPGIAFGFLAEGGALVVVGTAVALLALVIFFATHTGRALVWVPTGLLLGGALGNLADRAREGAVIDFIDPIAWPAFNIADSCIVIGVLVLLCVAERSPQRSA
jgi:signal peptidase II